MTSSDDHARPPETRRPGERDEARLSALEEQMAALRAEVASLRAAVSGAPVEAPRAAPHPSPASESASPRQAPYVSPAVAAALRQPPREERIPPGSRGSNGAHFAAE